jgi:hypothetical protein
MQHYNNHSFYYDRCHKIICKTVAKYLSNNLKPFLKVQVALPMDHKKPLPFTCLSSGYVLLWAKLKKPLPLEKATAV